MFSPSPSSRGLSGLFAGLLAGAVSAGCFAYGMKAFEGGGESLSYLTAYLALGLFVFSSMPLFMAGLGAGFFSVFVGALAGFAGLALKIDDNLALYYAGMSAVPAFVLSGLALWHSKKKSEPDEAVWFPEGYILTIATLFPITFLIVQSILLRHLDGGLFAQTAEAMRSALDSAVKAGGAETATLVLTPEKIEAVATYVARILPALAGLSWVCVTLMAALFAQISLQRAGKNQRPPIRLVPMIVPPSLLPAVALSGLAGFFAPGVWAYLGTNLCIMLCMPYFFVGLAVVHAAARRKPKGGTVLLVFFYLILSGLPWFAILVTLLGTVDQGLGLQRKLLTPSTKNGSP